MVGCVICLKNNDALINSLVDLLTRTRNGKFGRLFTFLTSECPEPTDVYKVYEMTLQNCLQDVRAVVPSFNGGLKPAANAFKRHLIQQYAPMWGKEIARQFLRY
jgi:hypothetical protein